MYGKMAATRTGSGLEKSHDTVNMIKVVKNMNNKT